MISIILELGVGGHILNYLGYIHFMQCLAFSYLCFLCYSKVFRDNIPKDRSNVEK